MSNQKIGICRFCGQSIILDTDLTEEAELNELASHECTCAGAVSERDKEMKLAAASEWIENVFKDETSRDAMKSAVEAVNANAFSRITLKVGKTSYAISLDHDKCICIKSKYTDTNEETF